MTAAAGKVKDFNAKENSSEESEKKPVLISIPKVE